MILNPQHICAAGESLIERLPSELLNKILYSVSSPAKLDDAESMVRNLPSDPNMEVRHSPCLLPSLITSRTVLAAALPMMYRNIDIFRLSTLCDFLAQLNKYPQLGNSVRRVDLSGIPSTSSSVKMSATNPLLAALKRIPLVREIRIGNSLSAFLNDEVLERLFCGLPYLEVLDVSGCNSPAFVETFTTFLSRERKITNSFVSLSLARCSYLRPETFENLLPQLSSLQYLDVSDTQITSAALLGIPTTSKLTHLNLSFCYALDRMGLVEFLIQSRSARSLVYLNLETLPGVEYQVLGEEDISKLLAHLLPQIRSLNLKNTTMNSVHATPLRTLSAQLEELKVGAHLGLRDIESLCFASEDSDAEEMEVSAVDTERTERAESKYNSVLNPMEEAIAICRLRQRISSVTQAPRPNKVSKLRYLDISSLPMSEQSKIQTSILLGPQTIPLQVIEVSEKVLGRCGGILPRLCAAVGWEVKSVGRRCWMRRR